MTSRRRSVPLGRRELVADRTRLIASACTVGLAIMLVLLLTGLWAGIQSQEARFVDRSGAQLYVLQPGVRSLSAGAGMLDASIVNDIAAVPNVDWTNAVQTQYAIVDLHGKKFAAYLIGATPGTAGSPWAMANGRAPRSDDEITIDQVVARQHNLKVGNTFVLGGKSFRIVGLSASTSGFVSSYFFVTRGAATTLQKSPDKTSMVLVGTHETETVRRALLAMDLNVLTSAQVRTNTLEATTGVLGTPIKLMIAIASMAGAMILALTSYALVAERRHVYGIVKALGGGTLKLTALAVGQTLVLAALSSAAGLLLFLGVRVVLAAVRPQFSVLLTANTALSTLAIVLGMAAVAAILPARRLATLDPAAAFRT